MTDDKGDEATPVLRLYHNSTTGTSPGNGCAILFQADNTSNNKQPLGSLLMEATDVAGYLSADFVVKLQDNSLDANEVLRVTSGGDMGIGTKTPQCRLDVMGAIRPGTYLISTAPDPATQGGGAVIFVSDSVRGARLVYSDGTDWRFISDDALLS